MVEIWQSILPWLSFAAFVGILYWLISFLGDHYMWLLGAVFVVGIAFAIATRKRMLALEKASAAKEGDTIDTAPDTPEPRNETEPQSAQSAQEEGVTTVKTSFINEQPGEKAHPGRFAFAFIALAVIYYGLYRALFDRFIPISSITLPNNLGSLVPDDFVPFVAFIALLLQRGMRTWRPAGFFPGLLDGMISLAPAVLIGLAFASWIHLIDAMLPQFLIATPSHFGTINAIWFGLGAFADIAGDVTQALFGRRRVTAVNAESVSPPETSAHAAGDAIPLVQHGQNFSVFYEKEGYRLVADYVPETDAPRRFRAV
jgi:hypothetical protein